MSTTRSNQLIWIASPHGSESDFINRPYHVVQKSVSSLTTPLLSQTQPANYSSTTSPANSPHEAYVAEMTNLWIALRKDPAVGHYTQIDVVQIIKLINFDDQKSRDDFIAWVLKIPAVKDIILNILTKDFNHFYRENNGRKEHKYKHIKVTIDHKLPEYAGGKSVDTAAEHLIFAFAKYPEFAESFYQAISQQQVINLKDNARFRALSNGVTYGLAQQKPVVVKKSPIDIACQSAEKARQLILNPRHARSAFKAETEVDQVTAEQIKKLFEYYLKIDQTSKEGNKYFNTLLDLCLEHANHNFMSLCREENTAYLNELLLLPPNPSQILNKLIKNLNNKQELSSTLLINILPTLEKLLKTKKLSSQEFVSFLTTLYAPKIIPDQKAFEAIIQHPHLSAAIIEKPGLFSISLAEQLFRKPHYLTKPNLASLFVHSRLLPEDYFKQLLNLALAYRPETFGLDPNFDGLCRSLTKDGKSNFCQLLYLTQDPLGLLETICKQANASGGEQLIADYILDLMPELCNLMQQGSINEAALTRFLKQNRELIFSNERRKTLRSYADFINFHFQVQINIATSTPRESTEGSKGKAYLPLIPLVLNNYARKFISINNHNFNSLIPSDNMGLFHDKSAIALAFAMDPSAVEQIETSKLISMRQSPIAASPHNLTQPSRRHARSVSAALPQTQSTREQSPHPELHHLKIAMGLNSTPSNNDNQRASSYRDLLAPQKRLLHCQKYLVDQLSDEILRDNSILQHDRDFIIINNDYYWPKVYQAITKKLEKDHKKMDAIQSPWIKAKIWLEPVKEKGLGKQIRGDFKAMPSSSPVKKAIAHLIVSDRRLWQQIDPSITTAKKSSLSNLWTWLKYQFGPRFTEQELKDLHPCFANKIQHPQLPISELSFPNYILSSPISSPLVSFAQPAAASKRATHQRAHTDAAKPYDGSWQSSTSTAQRPGPSLPASSPALLAAPHSRMDASLKAPFQRSHASAFRAAGTEVAAQATAASSPLSHGPQLFASSVAIKDHPPLAVVAELTTSPSDHQQLLQS